MTTLIIIAAVVYLSIGLAFAALVFCYKGSMKFDSLHAHVAVVLWPVCIAVITTCWIRPNGDLAKWVMKGKQ